MASPSPGTRARPLHLNACPAASPAAGRMLKKAGADATPRHLSSLFRNVHTPPSPLPTDAPGTVPRPEASPSSQAGEDGCHQRDAIALRAAGDAVQPRLSRLLLFLSPGAGGRLSSWSPRGWHRKDRQPWRNRGASRAGVPQHAPACPWGPNPDQQPDQRRGFCPFLLFLKRNGGLGGG